MRIPFLQAAACSLTLLVSGAAFAGESPAFIPIKHASFVFRAKDAVVYVDPVGEASLYKDLPPPDIILITHTHSDHLDKERIGSLKKPGVTVIGNPDAVRELGYGKALNNGETATVGSVKVEAVPAYNLSKDRLDFHPKGRDNGYLATLDGKRVYVSGDTEDIPEMRALKDVDFAFVCMNLPYTMTVEQAASAVLGFRPKVVIPYHYRGKEGMSDLGAFRRLVSADKGIEVRELKWY